MACERWCFNRGCDDGAARRRWPCILLLLALYVLDSSRAADNEFNRHHYELDQSRRQSPAEYGPIEFSYVSDDEEFGRQRRDAGEKMLVTTEQPVAHEQPQQPPQQKQQSSLQQPQSQQQPVPQTQSQPRQQQRQQSQQQPQPKAAQQPQEVIAPLNASVNVSYSTDNTNESSTVSSSPSPTVWTVTQEAPGTAKPATVTSPTAESPTKKSPAPNGLTNYTMWGQAADPNKNPIKSTNTTADSPVVKEESDPNNIGDISISKFSDVTNKTLSQHNISKIEYDTHQYYNSTFIIGEGMGKKHWVDIDNHPDLNVNLLLSQSHRRAATVKLKFDFPFYGHKVRNITIATGGFLYTGEYVHSWLAATQYIAPLMANFDTRLSNDSYVKYADNGTAFTVVWEKVVLQDKPDAGAFTFQVTLHQNGDIVFVYSVIPLMVEQIEDTAHPVKVGLSDAYIMDRIVFFVRRKTIYEYHRVNFNRQDIKNWTVIYLNALPTCLQMDNCKDCLTELKKFDCKWCSQLNQCSTGTFRSRQDWLLKGCDVKKIKDVDNCPASTTMYKEQEEEFNHVLHVHSEETVTVSEMNAKQERPGTSPLERSRDNNMNMGVSGIIGILLVVGLVVGLVAWAGYAYRNPHSASGQMLIRYRPSQWSWRRGEARYTAATIHM